MSGGVRDGRVRGRHALALRGDAADRWRSQLASSQGGLVALALLVGAGSDLGAVAFRYMILGLTYVFTGHRDYSAAGRAANPLVPVLGIWFVVIAPVLGGLVYGPLVARFAPQARGHGVAEVMLAVTQLGGRMRPQVPVVKSLASALCIGSGGSVGREGPIVQIGSALGSIVGQLARVAEPRLRLLVACGCSSPAALRAGSPPRSKRRSRASSSGSALHDLLDQIKKSSSQGS